jgi:Icc-related predicted phosphoesterase
MARIFFSVDVHGASSVWRKWIKAAKHYDADVLMLCGDLTGKALVPLIEEQHGKAVAFYFGRDWLLETEQEKKDMEKKLHDAGVYTVRATREEVQEWKQDPDHVEMLMSDAIEKRLREWLQILLDEIDTTRLTAVVMPGNDDDYETDDIIRDYEDRGIVLPLEKNVTVGGFETVSIAHTNPTPWDTPREAEERELARIIKREVSRLADPRRAIFNFHCPPFGTRLDLAPELDRNLRPITIAGQVSFKPVGSKAVRDAILRHSPMLGLHGHIHESYGAEKLGETVILNPGSEYGEGILRAFVIETSTCGLENYYKIEG